MTDAEIARLGDRSWITPHAGTRGPWTAEQGPSDWIIRCRDGHVVATVHDAADARLIAVATELRALCASMYSRMTTGSWADTPLKDKARWIEMLCRTLTEAGLEPPAQPERVRLARERQEELFGEEP